MNNKKQILWFVRHSERIDFVDKNQWEQSTRYKENIRDPPITKNGKKNCL